MSTWDSMSSEDRAASGKNYGSARSQMIDTTEHLGARRRITPSRKTAAVEEGQQPYGFGPTLPASNGGLGDVDSSCHECGVSGAGNGVNQRHRLNCSLNESNAYRK